MIDKTDATILRELLINGRKSFTKIAQETGLSRDIIGQHYNVMKREGIIVGSTIELDYSCLGYDTVGSLIVTVNPDKQDETIKSIRKITNVYGALEKGIEPKINVVVTLKNLQELEIVTYLIKQIPGVLGLKTTIWIGVRNMVHNLSVLSSEGEDNKSTEKEPKKGIPKHEQKIDLIDKKIIRKLANNGRMSYRKIAQSLDVSTDTVSRRVKNLTKKGIIKPLIQINPTKLGYAAKFTLALSFCSQSKLSAILDKISQIPDITLILKTSGEHDVYVIGLLKNIEHLFLIQDKIGRIAEITEMQTELTRIHLSAPTHSQYISTF